MASVTWLAGGAAAGWWELSGALGQALFSSTGLPGFPQCGGWVLRRDVLKGPQLAITPSRFIHIVTNGKISILMAE